MVEINTTPLIDVMLVLLIMLIITIPVQTHAVKLDMPRDNPPPALVKPEVIDLDIDFDGAITWNGAPLPDRTTLRDLSPRHRGEGAAAGNPSRAQQAREVRRCRAVLAESQRLGVVKIGLVGSEQYLD